MVFAAVGASTAPVAGRRLAPCWFVRASSCVCRPSVILGTLHLDGSPVAKARARTVVKDGKSHTYTPARTRDYERLIALSWRGPRGFTGLVKVTVRIIEGKGAHPMDLDNGLKSVLDGLNGVAWVDDRQVVAIDANIIRGDERPGLDIVVEGWD